MLPQRSRSSTLPNGHIFDVDYAECQSACEARTDCGAIEYKQNRHCELHPFADGAQTNGNSFCQCFRKPSVFTEVLPTGCCRNAAGRSSTLANGHLFDVSLTACQMACLDRADCGAIEYKLNRHCELHPATDGFTTNSNSFCRCYRL